MQEVRCPAGWFEPPAEVSIHKGSCCCTMAGVVIDCDCPCHDLNPET